MDSNDEAKGLECPWCSYSLRAITSTSCPECGNQVLIARPQWIISRIWLQRVLAMVVTVTSVLSVAVAFKGANDEPYGRYRASDALVQVGVGTALIALWLCISGTVVVLVATRKVSPAWLLILIWSGISMLYLLMCPFGYLKDLEQIVLRLNG